MGNQGRALLVMESMADKSGEFAGSSKRFGQTLEDRGFQPHRKDSGRGFYGLAIRLDDPHFGVE